MVSASLQTLHMHQWLDRMQAGDRDAANDLLCHAQDRLERLAHRMIRDFPKVRSCLETADLMQNAAIRLLRALRDIRPPCTRAFYALAAEQMRRELLDLARHHRGVHGPACCSVGTPQAEDGQGVVEALDKDCNDPDLEQWAAFHDAVAHLPAEEREVVGLIFYHGWEQAQVAELLHTTDRTVRRRWVSAMARLRESIQH